MPKPFRSFKPPKGFKTVGADFPATVADIINAADPSNFPKAMASIIGAIPWIAASVFRALPPEEYAMFRVMVQRNLDLARTIVDADDPVQALDQAIADATRHLH